jgi:hypothetical protein
MEPDGEIRRLFSGDSASPGSKRDLLFLKGRRFCERQRALSGAYFRQISSLLVSTDLSGLKIH